MCRGVVVCVVWLGKSGREWRTPEWQGCTELSRVEAAEAKWWGPHAAISGALETETGNAPVLLETRRLTPIELEARPYGDNLFFAKTRPRHGDGVDDGTSTGNLPSSHLRPFPGVGDFFKLVMMMIHNGVKNMQGKPILTPVTGHDDGAKQREEELEEEGDQRGDGTQTASYISHNPRDRRAGKRLKSMKRKRCSVTPNSVILVRRSAAGTDLAVTVIWVWSRRAALDSLCYKKVL